MNQQKTNMEREKFCFLQTMLHINQKLTSPVSTSKLEAEIKPSCEYEKFKYFSLLPQLINGVIRFSVLNVGQARSTDAMGNREMKLYQIIFKITFALVGISLYFTCRYVGMFCDFVMTQVFVRFAGDIQLADSDGNYSLASVKHGIGGLRWRTMVLTPLVVVLGAIYPVCLVILMAARLMLIEIPLKYLPSIIQ